MANYQFLCLERGKRLARLTLDRPPVNILHTPMLQEIHSALGVVGSDPEVAVLLIEGAGKAFCAGVDVEDHTVDRVEEMLQAFHQVVTRLLEFPVPTVVSVGGAALGGGFELLLASDIVLASSDAKMGQPEVRLGVFPPAATALLPRLIGRQRALDLILSGRAIRAQEAYHLGLISRVIPADDFEPTVEEYISTLAGLSPPVLRLAKRAVYEGLELPLAEALGAADNLYLSELMPLEDASEGIAAFIEKRDPVWKGA